MKPSTTLVQFVQDRNLPWISLNESTGRFEIVIDNHLLSTYRACPAHFMLYAVEGYHRRNGAAKAPERIWALDFGTLFHVMMEEYYEVYKKPEFDLEHFAIDTALKHWRELKMDVHLTHPEAQQMGGYPGFAALLLQYAMQFKKENENLNILASEVSFGKGKEVPIFVLDSRESASASATPWSWADIYLSGRMDNIADDGTFLLPLDHKTMNSFYQDPATRFLIDDGPTGYIFSLEKLLPLYIPESLIMKRGCNRMIVNAISKKIPKEGSRFKRVVIWKSTEALEAYRHRVIGTCNNLLNDLELYARGLSVPRDTSKCSNWYYRECQFADVHRQQDSYGEQATLQNGYIKLPVWNTQSIQPLYTED